MNKSLKRILPILLVLVVLGSIVWYMFVYDRDFTRDVLLSTARYFERNGNNSAASTFYDWAYRHANNSDSVAIELAQQFKNHGNYTKAEATLSNAISDGGSIELYIALCKTYVEQNKLLDAVTMLENISDAQVKAQIEALRPAEATVSLAPGTYNQYKTVTISCESGSLYVTTDGSHPSASNGVFPGSLTLVGGENHIRALVVGENGLVSHLAHFQYVVGSVVEEITFKESAVDALVRQYLGKAPEDPIMSNELWGIKTLTLPAELQTLEDLQHFPYLEILSVQNSGTNGLENISKLTYLKGVSINGCAVTYDELSAIAALPELTTLVLANCGLTNIAPLSAAVKLEALDLHGNTISDIAPLTTMRSLHTLNLAQNALSVLTDLSLLSELTTLSVAGNSVTSLAPLITLNKLTALDVSNNQLTNLSGVENMTALVGLYVTDNALTDISALAQLPALEELNISGNNLKDISKLGSIRTLVYLDFSRNQVTTLPKWDKDAALVKLEGSNNKISSLSNLSGLTNLNEVVLQNNQIKKLDPLADCLRLIKVNVFGNPVKSVTVLTKLSIAVIWNGK